ncbi:MAG: N-acetylmuramoyl-L-alanine amidase [Oscillatoria sp. SIO1A7]|nr:N-acetylmuramoyl-L-alanine amidase [Oscillatoria sp. SIO1A7]
MKNVALGNNLNGLKDIKVDSTVLWRWLLPSLVGAFLLTSPAEAATLRSWRFEESGNRLTFTTAGGVQPRAQLIADPIRLVIDLPGTSLGPVRKALSPGGAIREIRVGQVDSQTARIVVELARGYTLDPEQVKFEGNSASEWAVQIPNPEPIQRRSFPPRRSSTPRASAPERTPRASSPEPSRRVSSREQVSARGKTLLKDIEVTDKGIVLRTNGETPEIEVNRPPGANWMTLVLPNVTLSQDLDRRSVRVNRFGISFLRVAPINGPTPGARVTLDLTNNGANLETRASNLGGVLIWPEGQQPPTLGAQSGGLAKIESVEVRNNGTELVVNADQPIDYTEGWDRQTASYSITIYSAELAENIRLPRRSSGLSVRKREDYPGTVTLLVQVGNADIQGVTQPNPSQLSLKLRTNGSITNDPNGSGSIVSRPPQSPVGPPRRRPVTRPEREYDSPLIRRRGNERQLVIIDPGHGGSDPGAVGIGGLREKDVVNDISRQVTRILEENGIQVRMTRQSDRTLELRPRTELANRVNADLFVSIHANAAPGGYSSANGVETFYYQSGRRLAQNIQGSIMESFNMRNRGVKRARFYVLRHTRMPAVLVEVGFVTGSSDSRILAQPAQRSRMAQAIARGIIRHIRQGG